MLITIIGYWCLFWAIVMELLAFIPGVIKTMENKHPLRGAFFSLNGTFTLAIAVYCLKS